MKKPKKSDPKTIRFDADVLEALTKKSEEDDRSFSWLINWAVRVALKLDQQKGRSKSSAG